MKQKGILLVLVSSLLFTSCSNQSESDPGTSDKYYRIVWKNYDGSILETDRRVKENTIPTYNGSTPTRPADSNYTYTWSGWNPAVVAVTKDAIYTATYKSTPKGSGDPVKETVAAHTLKDSNPPVDPDAIGDTVTENEWNSFRNASRSAFANHYNFTYRSYSGGYLSYQYFTKNGYYLSSFSGNLRYERKSGSTFYQYISTSEGYLRQETTFDLQDKYTSIIEHEIYVHMFDYSDYTYNDYDGIYCYNTSAFSSQIKFKGGYIVYFYYQIDVSNNFQLNSFFSTEIEIPKSYYYK